MIHPDMAMLTRIGLLSDSHGRASITAEAAGTLVKAGAQVLVHLGDIGTPQVLDALLTPRREASDGGEVVPVHVVFGNTDGRADELARYAAGLGIAVDHPMGKWAAADRTVAFTHGHDERLMREALEGEVDYLCHGHTHRVRDERVGATRVINPGALHRAAGYSAAFLDTTTDMVRFYWLGES